MKTESCEKRRGGGGGGGGQGGEARFTKIGKSLIKGRTTSFVRSVWRGVDRGKQLAGNVGTL